jgi:hypothetical protein
LSIIYRRKYRLLQKKSPERNNQTEDFAPNDMERAIHFLAQKNKNGELIF